MTKLCSLFLSILMFFFPFLNIPEYKPDSDGAVTSYTNIFVHGLSGWGSYDLADKAMPYWGMSGGNLMTYLNARGYDCRSASVTATASAWDRACELYAQLTGTRTDYGKEHSERCGHRRYGENFAGRALYSGWSAENKINLFGHSFGGATVRMLTSLMSVGSEAERAATPAEELSPLFAGGRESWIYSVTTLSAPHNGTTAYIIKDMIFDDENATPEELATATLLTIASMPIKDGRDEDDSAEHNMYLDNAAKLNKEIVTAAGVYYFSYACDNSVLQPDGTYAPDTETTEALFIPCSGRVGKYTGVTPGGIVVDESWRRNDGLVNTVSAMYPSGAPHTDYDAASVVPGIWTVMPIYHGDHMSLQGGMTVKNNVRLFYAEHIDMLNSLGA